MESESELTEQISHLLFQLNDFLIETEKYKPDEENRITIPHRKISTAYDIVQKYSLNQLISSDRTKDNIAYTLMHLQLLKYFFSNFKIFGVVRDVYLKNIIVVQSSIIEAILYGSLESLHKGCYISNELCNKAHKCPVYIRAKGKLNFADLVEEYKKKFGGLLTDEISQKLMLNKARRDEIHIWDMSYHIYHTKVDFKEEAYKADEVLDYLRINLHPAVESFKNRRKQECRKGKFT